MVVLSYPAVEDVTAFTACKSPSTASFPEAVVPVIDLSDPNAKTLLVEACIDIGFFKVTNHAFSMEFLNKFEAECIDFFELSQDEKQKSGPPAPFGFGSKGIGRNGDIGWVEFLLLCAKCHTRVPGISDTLWGLVTEYVTAVRDMTCLVAEMIAVGLGHVDKHVLSKLMSDEKSDSFFRVNYYPAFSDIKELRGWSLIGFGEHTDPQILSVLRSNSASGLQICLKNGAWATVPSDNTTFFFSVGDSLQAMTNGMFQSIKHRVLANGLQERLSMVYFAGPPLNERIVPLFLNEGEESMYREFTWDEYRKSAYKTKLGYNRLSDFEKFPCVGP